MQDKRPAFNSFAGLEAHLDKLGLFRMNPGLERMRDMLSRLGLMRPPFAVVQVVGTNGKGSVSTMLARLGEEHGLVCGLHTSPHFVSVRERVRLNRSMLPGERWVELANSLMERGGAVLSYFEFVTCLAVLAFAEAGADAAVMETGLGGSFDATTALAADLVVFTPVGLDHQAVLGDTLADIASDKAGAIRPKGLALSAAQAPEVERALKEAARGQEAELLFLPARAGDSLPAAPGLAGRHQRDNAALALAAWRTLLDKKIRSSSAPGKALAASSGRQQGGVQEDPEARALARAWLPGRMQFVPPKAFGELPWSPCALGWPPLLLDGAHNGHGLAALGAALARQGIAPAAVIFACLEDKDLEAMLPQLRALATGPIYVPPVAGNPRAMRSEDLARRIGLNATPAESLMDALALAATGMAERLPEVFAGARPHNPLLVCGSLYMLGGLYGLRPDCLEAMS